MSCFIVSPKHIATIVEWAEDNGIVDNPNNAKETLALANVRSVARRYHTSLDDACQEGMGMSLQEYMDCVNYLTPNTRRLSKAQILKAVDCLEYQSCERECWETSAAKHLLDRVREAIPRYSSEAYQRAAWELH